jgi:hypothetical protein
MSYVDELREQETLHQVVLSVLSPMVRLRNMLTSRMDCLQGFKLATARQNPDLVRKYLYILDEV